MPLVREGERTEDGRTRRRTFPLGHLARLFKGLYGPRVVLHDLEQGGLGERVCHVGHVGPDRGGRAQGSEVGCAWEDCPGRLAEGRGEAD